MACSSGNFALFAAYTLPDKAEGGKIFKLDYDSSTERLVPKYNVAHQGNFKGEFPK